MDFGILTPILFFGGFMAAIAGLNIVFRWTNQKFPSDEGTARTIAGLEDRVAELEERLDFAEHALTEVRTKLLAVPRGDEPGR